MQLHTVLQYYTAYSGKIIVIRVFMVFREILSREDGKRNNTATKMKRMKYKTRKLGLGSNIFCIINSIQFISSFFPSPSHVITFLYTFR